ncbi:hypothetical protein CMEL01_04698 [Colletotrichum melonis]|uniref:Uncharacterized protein n=1 Tax=Colletotrichum melonis TaxID=1209925 RepID=A0AAI9UCP9_9PEZI|nr:hypothetical protein CMEL01_04698 [Colletotrichum melonis]
MDEYSVQMDREKCSSTPLFAPRLAPNCDASVHPRFPSDEPSTFMPPNPRVETAMFQYAWFLEGRAPGIRPYSIEPKSLGRILIPQGTVSPSPRMQHGDAGHTLVVDSRRAMLSNLLRSVSICRRRGRTVQCTDTEHYIYPGYKTQRPNNDCCPSTHPDNQPKHNHDTHAGK